MPPYLHVDDEGSHLLAPLVGALSSEVALMGSLTGNLHILMSSFYRPTAERYKIVLEGKAFPSDHVPPLFPLLGEYALICFVVCR
jgi:kynureninase